jgi:hypothetical protein
MHELCVCVHEYMYACMNYVNVCMNIRMSSWGVDVQSWICMCAINANMHVYIYVCMHGYMCHVNICICTYMYVCMNIRISSWGVGIQSRTCMYATYVNMYVYTYACMRMCMHEFVNVFLGC